MPSPLTPAQRLTRLKTTFPDGAHMARALSISVRAEPELVRQVRTILFAGSGAELEADLYFSPFVAQRTPDWILLDPLLSMELQEESARLIGENAGERLRMARVREAVLQAHSSAPSDITCEEDVIWLSVERSGGRDQALEAIEQRLRGPLVQLLQRSPESIPVARWFASAARRMPMLARETQAFALLAFAASSALGGRKIEAGASAGLETFDELARYLQDSVKRVPLWMALTSRGLHLSFSERRGHERVDVPLTDPVLLEVRGHDSERTLVQVAPGAPLLVPLAPGPVTVRTLSRDLLHFQPRAVRSAAVLNDVYISYAGVDADWVSALHEALNVRLQVILGRRDIRIWHYRKLAGNESFEDEIEENLRRSAVLLAVVSAAYVNSEYCRRELETFAAGSRATERRVLPVYRMPVDREKLSPRLNQLVGYEFFTQDPDTGRFEESSPSSERFLKGINQVARDIASVLRGHEEQESDVYVAATPDLDTQRQRLVRELQILGCRVATGDEARYESKACVLLIGQARGESIDSVLALVRRQTFRTYVWIPRNLDFASSENRELLERASSERGVEVLRTGFEDLVDYLGRTLRAPARADKEPDRTSRLVYLMCAREDFEGSVRVRQWLEKRGLDIRMSATEGAPSELRQAQRQALDTCDAVLIYWGSSNEFWLEANVAEADRARRSPGRGRPLVISIFAGHPRSPQKLMYAYPGVTVIHGEESEEEGLESLVRDFAKRDAAL